MFGLVVVPRLRDCAASRSRAARAPRRRSAPRSRTANGRAERRCCRRGRTARARSRARSSGRPCAGPAARSAAGRREAPPRDQRSSDEPSAPRDGRALARDRPTAPQFCKRSLNVRPAIAAPARAPIVSTPDLVCFGTCCSDYLPARAKTRRADAHACAQIAGSGAVSCGGRAAPHRSRRGPDSSGRSCGKWNGSVRKSPSGVIHSAGIPHSPGCNRHARKAAVRAPARRSICCTPSSGSSEHVQ